MYLVAASLTKIRDFFFQDEFQIEILNYCVSVVWHGTNLPVGAFCTRTTSWSRVATIAVPRAISAITSWSRRTAWTTGAGHAALPRIRCEGVARNWNGSRTYVVQLKN